MNRVHDLGGTQGLGPVKREENEPVFHEPWEGRVRVLMQLGLRLGLYNIDEFRWSVERMDPTAYLSASYYEKWLDAIERLYIEKGVIRPEELKRRQRNERPADPSGKPATAQPTNGVARPRPADRLLPTRRPRFADGDVVATKNIRPRGHTRLPRYVRGKPGVVHRVRGAYVLPDKNAMGLGAHPEYVYSVRFEARALWGEDAPARDSVYIDLWESYLKEGTARGPRPSTS